MSKPDWQLEAYLIETWRTESHQLLKINSKQNTNILRWQVQRKCAERRLLGRQRGSDLGTQCEPVCTGWWCPRESMGGNPITYAITINNGLKIFLLIEHSSRVNSTYQTYIHTVSTCVHWSEDVTFQNIQHSDCFSHLKNIVGGIKIIYKMRCIMDLATTSVDWETLEVVFQTARVIVLACSHQITLVSRKWLLTAEKVMCIALSQPRLHGNCSMCVSHTSAFNRSANSPSTPGTKLSRRNGALIYFLYYLRSKVILRSSCILH
jgi:hypothetical protein